MSEYGKGHPTDPNRVCTERSQGGRFEGRKASACGRLPRKPNKCRLNTRVALYTTAASLIVGGTYWLPATRKHTKTDISVHCSHVRPVGQEVSQTPLSRQHFACSQKTRGSPYERIVFFRRSRRLRGGTKSLEVLSTQLCLPLFTHRGFFVASKPT